MNFGSGQEYTNQKLIFRFNKKETKRSLFAMEEETRKASKAEIEAEIKEANLKSLFDKVSEKKEGESEGFVGEKNNEKYYVKLFNIQQGSSIMLEYIGAKIQQQLIGDKVAIPRVNLITHGDKIAISSQEIKGFQNYLSLHKEQAKTLKAKHAKLVHLGVNADEYAYDAFVSSWICGNDDVTSPENIGIQKESETVPIKGALVDLGRMFQMQFDSIEAFIHKNKAIYSEHLGKFFSNPKMDIAKFHSSLTNIVNSQRLNKESIKQIICEAILDLKEKISEQHLTELTFEFQDISYSEGNCSSKKLQKQFSTFSELQEFLANRIQANIELVPGIIANLNKEIQDSKERPQLCFSERVGGPKNSGESPQKPMRGVKRLILEKLPSTNIEGNQNEIEKKPKSASRALFN